MFKHLLVPLDGSQLAESALSASAQIAQAFGSRVTLLHVVERDAPEVIHGEKHLRTADSAIKYLDDLILRTFPALNKVEVRIEVGEVSTVARIIQDFALSAGADLIVMCAHGNSGMRHLLSGSNAQQVLACGTIPVLQVKPTQGSEGVFDCRHILVPVDGRHEDETGISIAAELARALDSELRLLTVVPTRQTLRGEAAAAARLSPVTAARMLDLALKDAEDNLRTQSSRLRKKGVRACASIERGERVSGILQVARRSEADLLVILTHRKAGADAFWAGSVAPKVTSGSEIPVLLIPA
jgi:nucleotide-binding universal stress UspA family protein